MISFTVPIVTKSEPNQREHWAKKARRVRQQREAVAWLWPKLADKFNPVQFKMRVCITRLAPRFLDDDNLAGSQKAVRDQIAAQLGIDDRNPLVKWVYRQRKSADYGVTIDMELA